MKTNTEEINMVGIDVSKVKLDIAINDKQFVTIKNNLIDFNKFIKGLGK